MVQYNNFFKSTCFVGVAYFGFYPIIISHILTNYGGIFHVQRIAVCWWGYASPYPPGSGTNWHDDGRRVARVNNSNSSVMSAGRLTFYIPLDTKYWK